MKPVAFALLPLALAAAPAAAQTPPPPTTTAAIPFLQLAGEGDVFEISSSQIALMRSKDADVRRFATMMTDHHTRTSNGALAAAKAAGILPPPAVLGPDKRDMITQLLAASPAEFDGLYWHQQLKAHEAALALQSTYASSGDTPQLRQAAATAVPIVTMHLDKVRGEAHVH